jgi:hypothetical protein
MRAGWTFALFALMAAAASAPATAQEVKIPSTEELSLQTFAEINQNCREWTDGCSVCQRGKTDYGRCSTPGIACEPGEIVCQRPAPHVAPPEQK